MEMLMPIKESSSSDRPGGAAGPGLEIYGSEPLQHGHDLPSLSGSFKDRETGMRCWATVSHRSFPTA